MQVAAADAAVDDRWLMLLQLPWLLPLSVTQRHQWPEDAAAVVAAVAADGAVGSVAAATGSC